jgi:hypothetical protein
MPSARGAVAAGAGSATVTVPERNGATVIGWKCAVSRSARRGQSNGRRLVAGRAANPSGSGQTDEGRQRRGTIARPPCPRINHFDWLGSSVGSGIVQLLSGRAPRKSAFGSRTSTSPTRDRKRQISHFNAYQPRPKLVPKPSEMCELLPHCSRSFQFRMKYGN